MLALGVYQRGLSPWQSHHSTKSPFRQSLSGLLHWAWVRGEGELAELLYAWAQVATGRVLVDDTEKAPIG